MRTKPPIIDNAKCQELQAKLIESKKKLDEIHNKALLGTLTVDKAKEVINSYKAGMEEYIIHCSGNKID